MGTLTIVAVLCVVSSASISAVVVIGFRRWRVREYEHIWKARESHLRELGKVRAALNQEIQRYAIAWHELGIDGDALQLACLELAEFVDPDDDEKPMYGATWQDVRTMFRDMAGRHEKTLVSELKKSFPVQISEEK
jgi:predicted TPR repeat methyltransferase